MSRPSYVSGHSPDLIPKTKHSNSASTPYFKSSNLLLLTHPVLNLFFRKSSRMMRTSTLISLLLLSILVHEARGMRSVKGSLSAKLHKLHEDVVNGLRRSTDVIGLEEPNLCKRNRRSESGRNRKLLTTKTTSTSSTTTSSENAKNEHGNNKANSTPEGQSSLGGKEENFSVNPSPVTEQHLENVPHDRYPDILDIAGMDYSPAKRKPPIHN